MKSFGFIIPSYCDSDIHLSQLRRCLKSIRNHHSEKIIIIDDYSTKDINLVVVDFDNIEIMKSPVKGAGDMVTYHLMKEHHLFDKAIIIQDSMTLEKKLDRLDEIDTISYLWYFTNHRHHWDHIEEPQDDYNIKHGIKVHDDLLVHCIDTLIEKEEFKKFAQDIYFQKNKWCGCFGCLSIVNYDFLETLNNKTGIIDIMLKMNNNRLRRAAESMFGLACLFTLGDSFLETAYDGLYYDGVNLARGRKILNSKDIGLDEYNVTIDQHSKTEYFSKIVFYRNL